MCGLHGDGNLTEENVEVGLNGGSITALVDSELGTIGAGVDRASSGGPLVERTGLSEVKAQVRLGRTSIGRAGLVEGIAARVGLGRSQRSGDGESRSSELHKRRHFHATIKKVWRKRRIKSGGQRDLND